MNVQNSPVDWHSSSNAILINPRIPRAEMNRLLGELEGVSLQNHCFLTTSGTEQSAKAGHRWVALSKDAILASAQAVNRHVHASANDIWIKALPDFHIGGLAILGRAFLSGAAVIEMRGKWSLDGFIAHCIEGSPTLASLVPTQLFDIVNRNIKSPPSLRVVFIGGGRTPSDVYFRALNLDWPLMLTYGMTETASQVATSEVGSQKLYLLPHMRAQVVCGHLAFHGESLLTGYITNGSLIDPKSDGWFVTNDLGAITESDRNTELICNGRASDTVKIGGELISLHYVDQLLDRHAPNVDMRRCIAVAPLPDSRLGAQIALAAEGSITSEALTSLVENVNKELLPVAVIRRVERVDSIPVTELGKLKRSTLSEMLELRIGKAC